MGRRRKSDRHLPERVYRRHGAYYLVTRDGRWVRLGRSYTEALMRYAELVQDPDRPVTLGAIMDRYLREEVPRLAPSTQAEYTRMLGLLRRVFGHMRPEQVRPSHVYAYLDRRPPTAGRHEKALLSTVYQAAIRWGLADANPVREVQVERRPRQRARYLTDDEYRAAWERAPEVLRIAMDLAVLTGLRRGDILRLRWQDVTEEGLRVQTGKTGAVVVFEWSPGLRDVIRRCQRLRGRLSGLWLICTRDGQRYTDDGFSAVWQRFQRRLEAEGLPRFRFHDLRRKAAADAERAGGREYARRLLGHASQAMTARYVGGIHRVRPLR